METYVKTLPYSSQIKVLHQFEVKMTPIQATNKQTPNIEGDDDAMPI